ncbi:MAG TPA: SpoIIE family protein phosphatase [Pyrinomonadaceae bacterium]|jgi:sigma-B regulation protein RsbU (phosphoserine phosphatase)
MLAQTDSVTATELRSQLLDRREKLMDTITTASDAAHLLHLLHEVDDALARMDAGSYGVCEVCHDEIERERLVVDPLVRFCLPHLTPREQRALEQDLTLAAQMQAVLLPRRDFSFDSWQISYHYEPLGPVGGDYLDLVRAEDASDALYFFLGDVAGKGVASALLVAQLHAVFRSLIALDLPLAQLVTRANRIFCERTIPAYYATVVCGRVSASGMVEMVNAGHCPPLLLRPDGLEQIEATGLPLGLFYTGDYAVRSFQLQPGETLFLYTDGLAEARALCDVEYGAVRLAQRVSAAHALAPDHLIDHCLTDLHSFLSGAAKADDLTIMALRRV